MYVVIESQGIFLIGAHNTFMENLSSCMIKVNKFENQPN